MLMIRLQRTGKRGQAYFRVIVVEHTKKPKGEYLELLGNYNPHEKVLNVKKDRIDYWVSKGAKPSPTVNNLLVNHKIWDKPKVQSWKPKAKPTPTSEVGAPTKASEKTVKEEPKEATSAENSSGEPKETSAETQPKPAAS